MVDEQLQNELAVRFHVSLQCVSCELKFFTGYYLKNDMKLQYSSKLKTPVPFHSRQLHVALSIALKKSAEVTRSSRVTFE